MMKRNFKRRTLAGAILIGWCALLLGMTESFLSPPEASNRKNRLLFDTIHYHQRLSRELLRNSARTTVFASSPSGSEEDKQDRPSTTAAFDNNKKQEENENIRDPGNDEDFKAWVSSRVKQWPRAPPLASQQASVSSSDTVEDPKDTNSNKQSDLASGTIDAFGGLLRSAKSVVTDESLFRMLSIESLIQLAKGASYSYYVDPAFNQTSSEQTSFDSSSNNSIIDNNNRKNSTNPIGAAAASAATAIFTNLYNTTALEELSVWNKWVGGALQPDAIGKSAEVLLKQATAGIESLVSDASSAVKPETVQDLIRFSSETLRLQQSNSSSDEAASELTVEDDDRIRQTTAFAQSLLATADGLLRKGYVFGDPIAKKEKNEPFLEDVPAVAGSRALFDAFETAIELNAYSNSLVKAAEMGALAGAIYEDTLPRTRALGQTIVARGVTQDVAWMVTDTISKRSSFIEEESASSTDQTPILVRTITIRGYDASDDTIDRELLLNRICTANPQPIKRGTGIRVHGGLLEIAEAIFKDVKQYVDWTAPTHKVVLNGHSVGGSLSLLLLMLMRKEYGADFTRNKILKVFTFGSPPVAVIQGQKPKGRKQQCEILEAFQLPTSMVHGFCQPLDPILRLFSDIDALYPLVNDLGPDGNTPFADGPPRALRPMTKALLESLEGWPRFRENFRGTANQTYTSVGVQHLILPSPTRYLADRFVAVNIPVPPVATILRISCKELYPALEAVFPLDVFEISYIPQAIRSVVHHFYPAYGFPLVDYVKELQRQSQGLPERNSEFAFSEDDFVELSAVAVAPNGAKTENESAGGIDWGQAVAWLTKNEGK